MLLETMQLSLEMMILKGLHGMLKSKNSYISVLMTKSMYIFLLIITSTCKHKIKHYIRKRIDKTTGMNLVETNILFPFNEDSIKPVRLL
jgi:hypothetical protein